MMRMKRFRFIILATIAGLALVLPWSEVGSLCIMFIVPFVLGILIAWLYCEGSIAARCLFLLSLVTGVTAVRLCWEDRFHFIFDGEWGLIAVGLIVQLLVAGP